MGQVHNYNFSTCQISKDGKYLIPDSVFLIPVQESKIETYAEYFDHWDNYTSMTSTSINLDATFYSVVSGKFSTGYSTTKLHMYNDNAKSTRIQIRNKLYTVKLQPASQLHPAFKSRVYDIASSIQNNNTDYAQYQAEMLIRDYGTHYVSSIDAGAILSQIDFVRSVDSMDSFKHSAEIKASASANFFKKVSLSTAFDHGKSTNSTTDFINNRTYSQVVTVGGPPFIPNMTLEEWEKGIPNALVAIDRSGDPLHFAINPAVLSKIPETTTRMVSDYVRKAINRYYKVNTRHGCTDPSAKNFDFHANLNDNTCTLAVTNFTFGGIFQNCTRDPDSEHEDLCKSGPDPAFQLNPLTGDLSCPPHYTPVLLHSGSVTHVTQKPQCHKVCRKWCLINCCHCETAYTSVISIAHYDAYWCAALSDVKLSQNDGYLFGGYYTSKASNPITGAMACPRFFYPLHLGEDIKVCVSTDYEQGFAYAVDFAGFDSCTVGNPLASPSGRSQANWPHACPHGYAQHLVSVSEGCEINFCVRAGAFNPHSFYSPRLPPFRKHPKYKYNVSNTLALFGVYGEIWLRNDEGGWDEVESGSANGQALLQKFEIKATTDDKQLSGSVIAVISVLGTLCLGMLIVVVIFTGRCAVKYHRKRVVHSGYVSLNDPADGEGSDDHEADTSAANPV